MRSRPEHREEAAIDVVAFQDVDGMTFREIADAAMFAVVNAFVESCGRELRLPTTGPGAAALRADAKAADKLSWLLLRQPFIGEKSLFACYQRVYYFASIKHYLEETAPSSPTHGDEQAAVEKARDDAEELEQFLKGLLP